MSPVQKAESLAGVDEKLLSLEKGWNPVIWRDVDGPWVCHPDWSESEREEQINACVWSLEKWCRWTYLQGRNRDAGLQCGRVDTEPAGRLGRTESSPDREATPMENRALVGTGRVAPEPSLVPWDGLERAIGRRGETPEGGVKCVRVAYWHCNSHSPGNTVYMWDKPYICEALRLCHLLAFEKSSKGRRLVDFLAGARSWPWSDSWPDTLFFRASPVCVLPSARPGGVLGSLLSVLLLTVVPLSGHRTQQCEERGSTAKKHQEARCRDLFQWRHLQDFCLRIRLVGGGGPWLSSPQWAPGSRAHLWRLRRSRGWRMVQSPPDGVCGDAGQWHQPRRAWPTGHWSWERAEWYVKKILSSLFFNCFFSLYSET